MMVGVVISGISGRKHRQFPVRPPAADILYADSRNVMEQQHLGNGLDVGTVVTVQGK